jgi:hypothetical protein
VKSIIHAQVTCTEHQERRVAVCRTMERVQHEDKETDVKIVYDYMGIGG